MLCTSTHNLYTHTHTRIHIHIHYYCYCYCYGDNECDYTPVHANGARRHLWVIHRTILQSESVSVHATVIYVIFQKCLCISHFYHAVCAPAAVVVVVACGTCLSCTPHFTRIDANKRPKRAKIKTERERERERTRQENCELHFK